MSSQIYTISISFKLQPNMDHDVGGCPRHGSCPASSNPAPWLIQYLRAVDGLRIRFTTWDV